MPSRSRATSRNPPPPPARRDAQTRQRGVTRKPLELRIETLLLAARWLLAPLYVGLIVSLLAIYGVAGRELVHLFVGGLSADTKTVLQLLMSLLDLVLVANLVLMVAIASYESFISRIQAADETRNPEWLGKLDSGNVKVKVAVSVVMISAIHLLPLFLDDGEPRRLIVPALVHVVFLLSAMGLAWVDRIGRHA
jgi:uncharacterized protein (TIGR00645 family)